MDSSWLGLGLDDFFSSSRLSSRRSRVSLRSELPRSRLEEAMKIDFGPDRFDFDSASFPFGESLLREFEDFPRKTSSKLHSKSKAFGARPKEQSGSAAEGARSETEYESEKDLRLKLHHCQREIMQLQDIINDLTQVNKRWQKYNSERQVYVQNLLSTIQDQQEQLNLIGEKRSFPPAPSPTAAAPTTTESCETDVERLRCVEQKLKEKVSILEFQVKAHRDDWEAELNEKRQALKDKEAVERKVAELTRDLLLLTPSGEVRGELYCQNCGRVTDVSRSPPSRSRLYRTAVHLPCSSSHHSSSTSISTTGEELVLDSKELRRTESHMDCEGVKMWNIPPDEMSYSRCSTVPLVSPPGSSVVSTTPSASSLSGKPAPLTVKSFVQIPITKSSSVPEGSAKLANLSRKSLDSFQSSFSPPVSVINSADQYDGTETNSAEDVICLRCGEVFPPNMHLQFLDHFPRCQSNRSHRMVSRDGTPNV